MTANEFLLSMRNTIGMLTSGDIPLFINGSQVGDVKCSVEGEGTTIHIDMYVEPETIKKGDKLLCIQTVVMEDEDSGEITYIEGKEYVSEIDNCITDEQGCDHHYWSEKDNVWDYFMKLNQ